MSAFLERFAYNPEWSVLAPLLKAALDHDHEGQVDGRESLSELLTYLEQRDRQLEDYLSTGGGPVFRARQTLPQSLTGSGVTPNDAPVALDFTNTVEEDSSKGWESANRRYFVSVPGLYSVTAGVEIAVSGYTNPNYPDRQGQMYLRYRWGQPTTPSTRAMGRQGPVTLVDFLSVNGSIVVRLNAGDIVQACINHDFGDDITTSCLVAGPLNGLQETYMTIYRVGD